MRALGVVLGLAALAVAQFWFVIHPDVARRGAIPGDFGTGALFFGAGTHHPTYTIAHTHLLYPLNVLLLGLAEQDQAAPLLALENRHVLPRAFLVPRARVLDERHRVEVRAEVQERPQYLLLADHWARWWRVSDNGRPARVLRADHDLRAVRLEPGRHEVVFRLAYPLFGIGAAVSAVSLAVAIAIVLVGGGPPR